MSHDDDQGGMDPLSAHLDRGWDLVAKGDFRGASKSAHHVLDLDAEAPEAYTLLGAIACGEGEPDEALEYYRKAMSLDPEYVEPILEAAETIAFRLADEEADLEEASRLCDEAIELLDEQSEEWPDAVLLKAEVLLSLGDEPNARAALAELPAELAEPVDRVRAGRLLLDLGDLVRAEEQLTRAVALDPELADAHHALGLLHEEREEFDAMVAAWQRVRALDGAEPAPAWALEPDELEAQIERALEELPEGIRKLLGNVPIIVDDAPSAALVAEGFDPRMLGLFDGVPYGEKETLGAVPQLDRIHLYQRNLERAVGSRDELVDEIGVTLIHETGHFFSLTDEQLEEMGLG